MLHCTLTASSPGRISACPVHGAPYGGRQLRVRGRRELVRLRRRRTPAALAHHGVGEGVGTHTPVHCTAAAAAAELPAPIHAARSRGRRTAPLLPKFHISPSSPTPLVTFLLLLLLPSRATNGESLRGPFPDCRNDPSRVRRGVERVT